MRLNSNSFSKKEHFSDNIDITSDFLHEKGKVFKSLSEINIEMLKICNSQSEKLQEFDDFLDKTEMDEDLRARIKNGFSEVIKNHTICIQRIDHLWGLIAGYLNHLIYV
jgi:hypothetical protein